MQELSKNPVFYEIDADDRIIGVSDNWLRFAAANEAPDLTPQAVIGKSLWTYIQGRSVRYLYREIFSDIRERHRSVVFPFRCDSPGTLRFMELSCQAHAGHSIRFTAQLLREEARHTDRKSHERLSDLKAPVRVCSWCKRVHHSDDAWIEIGSAVNGHRLLERAETSEVTHGVCPDCEVKLREQMASE